MDKINDYVTLNIFDRFRKLLWHLYTYFYFVVFKELHVLSILHNNVFYHFVYYIRMYFIILDGRSVLLLAQSEVDKTGASYYGKTQLHYVDVEGETSMVQLPKEGPIYHLLW